MADCIFCKIIKGELSSKPIYKDKDLIVFYDISPKAPVHFLVVPSKHLKSLQEAADEDKAILGKMMVTVKKTAERLNINEDGYKVVINNGEFAGQQVFHLHAHVLGGWKKKENWRV